MSALTMAENISATISVDKSAPVLELRDICKDYEQAAGLKTRVLNNINLTVRAGEFVAIMGPSGSGKSTLMNIIGALDRPTSGSYILAGSDVASCDDRKLANLRNATIGFVFQGFNLLSRRSAAENIALPLIYSGISRSRSLQRAEELLEKIGLLTHRDYLPSQMSGGQQQRIAIARALAMQPELLLADEPTGNLDSATSDEIMKIFADLHQAGMTIILITHENDVANHAKRLVQIKDGAIVYDMNINNAENNENNNENNNADNNADNNANNNLHNNLHNNADK